MPEPGALAGGRYAVEERIGRGGMSEVYRATDQVLERPVALKVLADHLLDDRAAVERFRREARTVARLTDPGIVAVHDAVTEPQLHAIVLELVDGPTLADRLRNDGPLPVAEALEVARQIARALETAHSQGLVHRDIKPSNILFEDRDTVKVTDFGIAAIVDATTTLSLHGSAPYLAPEQASGGPPDPRTDVYAVGCLLTEMLTGDPPFRGQTTAELVSQHLHAPIPLPSDRIPTVGPGIDAVVERCLQKNPADRYDVVALRQDLERLAAGVPFGDLEATKPLPAAAEPTLPHRPRDRVLRRLGLVVGLVVVAATAAFGTASVLDREPVSTAELVAVSPRPEPTTSSSPGTAPAGFAGATTPRPAAPTTVAAARVSTPADVVQLLRALLADGRLSGEVTARRVDEIERRLTELLAKLEDGKVDDARKKLEEVRKKLDEGVERLEISEELGQRMGEHLDTLEGLLV